MKKRANLLKYDIYPITGMSKRHSIEDAALQLGSMTPSRNIPTTAFTDFENLKPTTADMNICLENRPLDLSLYALTMLLFAAACYLFLVLCLYLYRFLRNRRRSTNTTKRLVFGYDKIALAMRFVAVIISLLCFSYFVFEQIVLHSNCCDESMQKVSQLIYGFLLMLSYIFFWLRQRVLYDAPAMRLFHNKFLRVLSWCSLGFVILNSASQIATTCLLPKIPNPTWVYLSWLIGCLVVQGCLMTLFTYPLQKHIHERKQVFGHQGRKVRKHNTKNGSRRHLKPGEAAGIRDSNIFTVSSSRSRTGASTAMIRSSVAPAYSMFRAARRCFVCAAIAFFTDIVGAGTMIAAHYTNWNTHEAAVIMRFLFGINLIVNSGFVVGCFSNWRYILHPECFRFAKKEKKDFSPTVDEQTEATHSVK